MYANSRNLGNFFSATLAFVIAFISINYTTKISIFSTASFIMQRSVSIYPNKCIIFCKFNVDSYSEKVGFDSP